MNELDVKINFKPAEIKFNHKEIEEDLEETLKHYKNLVFTEDSMTDLRKTLTDLRKGKKAINRYRIDTKKELNQPVLKFEEKCKSIEKKIDEVVNPLNDQLQEYVERQREEKRKELEKARDGLIKEYELNDEYAAQVEVLDTYLTASASINTSTESIKFEIEKLKLQQDKDEQDKQMIETTVRLKNAENDLSLSTNAYVRLLEFDDIETVQNQIENDVQKEIERKAAKEKAKVEAERKEQERLEKEKKKAELEAEKEKQEAIEREAKERIFSEQMERIKDSVIESAPVLETPEIEVVPFTDIADPFSDVESPFSDEEINGHFERTYKVYGTGTNLELLETFMNENGIEWSELYE